MTRYFLLALLFASSIAYGQDQPTQVIRGTVVDKVSRYPLIGAFVQVTLSDTSLATSTDIDGVFKIAGVPLGRHTVRVQSMGYSDVVKQNVLVNSGKEVVLRFEVEEKVYQTNEVTVRAKKNKSATNNQNVVVSARTFDIEETQRFAGSINDPARMVQNFAGVANSDDSRNDIIVRGNSPLGIQYRLNGMVIPNPNHFGALGTTGGPVSILNNNLLANSDFLTGAFPSEYGNVLAGVFDLQLRNGNPEKYEFLGQVGFNGLELGAEGPISKKNRSSFVASYRYSTLEVFQLLGLDFGTNAIPQYQDATFKIDVPTKKAGKFSIFGIGGISYIELLGSDLSSGDIFGENDEDIRFGSNMGVAGVSHTYFHTDRTHSKSGITVSGTQNTVRTEQLFFNADNSEVIGRRDEYGNDFDQVRYGLNYSLNKKFDSRNNVSVGVSADIFSSVFKDSVFVEQLNDFETLRDFEGATTLMRSFIHWQHKFSDKLVLNSGLHYQLLTLNGTQAVEPRVGVKYKLNERRSVSLGTGLHSMMQTFQVYFREQELENGTQIRTNEDLGFTRSFHVVGGYDQSIAKNMRLKAELYYQYIFGAPVTDYQSTFSMLNAGADFGIPTRDSLVNDGLGRNYGLELTLEHFFDKGYYFLITNSIFNSEYQGGDKVWRSTAFNNHFVSNALVGKEFTLGKMMTLALDLKMTWAGGKRFTPIDVEESMLEGETIFVENEDFSAQHPNYFRTDFKVALRRNGKKITQEYSVDVRNISNRKNVFNESFDLETGETKITYQTAILPIVQYRILF